MIHLNRGDPPACLRDGTEGKPTRRVDWYGNLRKQDGTIKDRWNSEDLDSSKVSAIRRSLEALSDKCCAYCERKLQKGWQVDHWLPQKCFPLVVYCWENLLPSCPGCNRRKSKTVPPKLKDKDVVDPVLGASHPNTLVFFKPDLFPVLSVRLVDPSFDAPQEHLEFLPLALAWQGRTEIGDFTVSHLLKIEKDDAKDLESLLTTTQNLIETKLSPDFVFDVIVGLVGQPTVVQAMIAHCQDMLASAAIANEPSPAEGEVQCAMLEHIG